jgi:hypothetical protein
MKQETIPTESNEVKARCGALLHRLTNDLTWEDDLVHKSLIQSLVKYAVIEGSSKPDQLQGGCRPEQLHSMIDRLLAEAMIAANYRFQLDVRLLQSDPEYQPTKKRYQVHCERALKLLNEFFVTFAKNPQLTLPLPW